MISVHFTWYGVTKEVSSIILGRCVAVLPDSGQLLALWAVPSVIAQMTTLMHVLMIHAQHSIEARVLRAARRSLSSRCTRCASWLGPSKVGSTWAVTMCSSSMLRAIILRLAHVVCLHCVAPVRGLLPVTLACHAEHITSGDGTATMWAVAGLRLRDILDRIPDLQRGSLHRHPISSRPALGCPSKPRLGSSSHRSRHQHGSKRRHRPLRIRPLLPEAVACSVLWWTCCRGCVAEVRRSNSDDAYDAISH